MLSFEAAQVKFHAAHEKFRWTNDVSSEAHIETMRAVKGGQREHLAEATFKYKVGVLEWPAYGLPMDRSPPRLPSTAASVWVTAASAARAGAARLKTREATSAPARPARPARFR